MKQLQKALISIIDTLQHLSIEKIDEDQLSYFIDILKALETPAQIPQKMLVDFFSGLQTLYFEMDQDQFLDIHYKDKCYHLRGFSGACSDLESEIQSSILNTFCIKKETSTAEIETLIDEMLAPYFAEVIQKGRELTPAFIPNTPPAATPEPNLAPVVVGIPRDSSTHQGVPYYGGLHPYGLDSGMLLWGIFRRVFPVIEDDAEYGLKIE